jgi:hypothetical protein
VVPIPRLDRCEEGGRVDSGAPPFVHQNQRVHSLVGRLSLSPRGSPRR